MLFQKLIKDHYRIKRFAENLGRYISDNEVDLSAFKNATERIETIMRLKNRVTRSAGRNSDIMKKLDSLESENNILI